MLLTHLKSRSLTTRQPHRYRDRDRGKCRMGREDTESCMGVRQGCATQHAPTLRSRRIPVQTGEHIDCHPSSGKPTRATVERAPSARYQDITSYYTVIDQVYGQITERERDCDL